MILLKLQGGLGNQMFQYATGLALSKKLNTKLNLDLRFYSQDYSKKNTTAREYELDCFSLQSNHLHKSLVKGFEILAYKQWLNFSLFEEKEDDFNPEVNSLSGNIYLIGNWQSEKYFKEYKDLIRKSFEFIRTLSEKNMTMLEKIKKTNSVSVHVRRTDYVQDAQISKVHQVCDLDYYKCAIKKLSRNVKNPNFFVFSDDIKWCKQNLKTKYSTTYVDHNTKGYHDMRLMSQCQHNIIANSSFSWWGAWLNNNPKKIVIAPRRWFKNRDLNPSDRFPSGWITI